MRILYWLLLPVILGTLSLACGGGGGGSNPVPSGTAPSITTQPSNQSVTVGQTATFTVVASGTAPLTYQWSKNGTAITGASSASYVTPATTADDNGATFTVTVSNATGNAPSNAATLTVSGTSASSFAVASAPLTLPVPPSANVSTTPGSLYYPPPYSGTVTLTVSRSAGFTGAVTLSVAQSSLPANVKANFANAADSTGLMTIVPALSTTATLSIQAGYPDPTDSTFTKQLYPAPVPQSKDIPINASASGATGTNGTLTLNLVQEPADFALTFMSPDGSAFNDFTTLSLVGAAPTSLTESFMAYWAVGTYNSPYGPVVLSTSGVPSNLTVSLDTHSATLNDVHTMTITASAGLQAGTYSFLLTGSYLGVTHTLPVLVTYSPYPFSLQPPLSSTVTISQGQTLSFPLYLWHNDAYFGTTSPTSGDPNYVGATNLTVSASNGLTVGFSNASPTADPTGLASVPLSITASPSLAPGNSYSLNLQATRVGAGGVTGATVQAAQVSLTVKVTSFSDQPTLWIQNLEWGQTVVSPNLRLVGGKSALLRVQLLADRSGVSAPTVTARVRNQSGTVLDTVTLQGPATVPTSVSEGDLPGTTTASTYTAILPGADIKPGMQVTITAPGVPSQTLNPSVDPGYVLNLTVVPVYCQGVAPVLPPDSVMSQELAAFWPVQSVNVTHRAPYTTSTVIPPPSANPLTDTSGDGWVQLLQEMASLRIVDGSTANYYGFFNPSLPAHFTRSIVGISNLGDGVGIGLDVPTANLFQNNDDPLDMATTIMVHEEGHAFNLNHAPAGGAGDPQLNYPYFGAATGTWGFDPATLTAYDPTTHFDVMSYALATHWVSDWDYLSALGFLGERENPPVSLMAVGTAAAATEQWVVSGWVRPDGQVRLAPLIRATCAQAPPRAGELKLILKSGSTTRALSFSASQVPDLPAGYRHFAFTVPATDELTSAEVRTTGQTSMRASARSLLSRAAAMAASAQHGSLVVQESGHVLHLEWDAQIHPYVNVLYEGSSRTTLALNLTGGSADLPLAGLPAGGQFVIHYSDGLNAAVHRTPRPVQP